MKTRMILSFLLILALVQAITTIAQQPLRKAPSRAASSTYYRGVPPRKLTIEAADRNTAHRTGTALTFVISLLDNNNKEVVANKDVAVQVTFSVDEKNISRRSVTIPAGRSRATISYTPGRNQSGILRVSAVNPELLEGYTFVKVHDGSGASMKTSGNCSLFQFVSLTQPSHYPSVSLLIGTSREYLADGIDEAKVLVSFEDPDHRIAADSILVFASSGEGQILPQNTFYLNRNNLKEFKLISKRTGIIKPHLEVRSHDIPVENNEAEIRFIPPIDFFKITAGPADIHLLSRTKIVVTLFDRYSVPIETDRDMRINLFVVEGDGSLLPDTSLVISKGSSNTAGFFIPNSTGKVLIEGHIPSFDTQVIEKPIQVSWPLLIIAMILAGGFLGSLAFLLYKKPDGFKSWFCRIAAGLISGLVLYLLFVTGVYKNVFVLSNINLTLVCLVAVAGGYLGEDVLVIVGEKFKGLMKFLRHEPSAG